MPGAPGKGGRVPKRSGQKHGHRTQAERDSIQSASGAALVTQPGPDEGWHRVARDWFVSLAESGQAQFYEPSDWQRARYVAEAMSQNLTQGRFSAQLFAAVNAAATELLDTEGSRRRLKLELQRPEPEQGESAAVVRLRALDDDLTG